MSSPFDKRLVLVLGKGGVGRSTVAASIAAESARRGRKTLLFEYNANDRYASLFGRPGTVGTDIVQLAPNLSAINSSPAAALEEYGLMILRFRRVYNMVFENRVTKYFLRAIPGLDDYSILGKVWYHTTETHRGKPAWDTVVFDMAASGHSLSMLRIPKVILQTVPDGPLTRDARTMQALLKDRERTAIVLTTLAEEMPTNEALELSASLESDLELAVTHLVINQVVPKRIEPGSPTETILEALIGDETLGEPLASIRAHAEMARDRRGLNERYIEILRAAFQKPIALLPRLFAPKLGKLELEKLRDELSTAWG